MRSSTTCLERHSIGNPRRGLSGVAASGLIAKIEDQDARRNRAPNLTVPSTVTGCTINESAA